MNFSIYCLYVFFALLKTTSGLKSGQNDALQEYGYKVDTDDDGRRWSVSRNSKTLNEFFIDTSLSKLTVSSAWNFADSKPRLPMREILALVLDRAGIPLDGIVSVRARYITNKETKQAIAKARHAIGVQEKAFTVKRGGVGWDELTKSPPYLSLSKLFTERDELHNRQITSITVLVEGDEEDDLDTMYLLIGDKTG